MGKKRRSNASYGGHSEPSIGPWVLLVLLVATIAHISIYDWGAYKVSKMLPFYPDQPRVIDSKGIEQAAHIKSQLIKAKQRIEELSAQGVPENRETIEEEKARWQEQKEHLLSRIAELEEKILLVVNANGEHTSNDSAFIGRLAEGAGL